METLRAKRCRFTTMVANLILYANKIGYEVNFGEAFRSKEEAARRSLKKGTAISNSLHTLGLAVDLNLYKDGVYIESTEGHKLLGIWWEENGGSWGGRFSDGNHYSLEHEGVK